MKKILMTLAAVLCCAMATTVFTACSEEENNPNTYTYEVAAIDAWGEVNNESSSICNEMNKAVEQGRFFGSSAEKEMKSRCQKIIDQHKNSVKSAYLTFTLSQSHGRVGEDNQTTELASYQLGYALTTPSYVFKFSTNIKDARTENKNLQSSLSPEVYKASAKTLLALESAFEKINKEFMTIKTVGYLQMENPIVFKKDAPYKGYPTADAYFIHACDSVVQVHEQDTLAVSPYFILFKGDVISKQTEDVWTKQFDANVK